MGFKYTDDQITNLIAVETDYALTKQDAARVETQVRRDVQGRSRGLSSSDLLQAIGNEFRLAPWSPCCAAIDSTIPNS